jgi:hypothetical protein
VPQLLEETCYTIPEIADRLKIDRHVVTEIFKDERGVIVIGNTETTKRSRKYRSFRVPASVLTRVLARLAVK